MLPTRFKSSWRLSTEALIGLGAIWFAITANHGFWRGVLSDRDLSAASTWIFIGATGLMLTALHFVLMALVATRHTVRPVLAALLISAACARYYTEHYGTVIDPSMLRNVLVTDRREAGELIGLNFIMHIVLWGVIPALSLVFIRIQPRPWTRALVVRSAAVILASVVGLGALLSIFQDFGSVMRNRKSLRYTPRVCAQHHPRAGTTKPNQLHAYASLWHGHRGFFALHVFTLWSGRLR